MISAIAFCVLLFCMMYFVGTPDVYSLSELSAMDIFVTIAAMISAPVLVHSITRQPKREKSWWDD
jgi:hypothetical protein